VRRKVWLVGYLRRIWSFDLGKEDPLMSTLGVAETLSTTDSRMRSTASKQHCADNMLMSEETLLQN
jgi:hypothetical protein